MQPARALYDEGMTADAPSLPPRIHLGSLLRREGDASASGELDHLDYRQGSEALSLSFAEPAPYEIDVNSLQGNEFWLQGSFEPTLVQECSRCLRPVEVPLSIDLGTLLQYRPSELEPFLEESEAGEEILVFGDPDLDLSNYLAEITIMSTPLSVLHDPGCKGLCQVCGHDLNDGPCAHSAAVPIESPHETELEAEHDGEQHARQNPFAALQGLKLPEE